MIILLHVIRQDTYRHGKCKAILGPNQSAVQEVQLAGKNRPWSLELERWEDSFLSPFMLKMAYQALTKGFS